MTLLITAFGTFDGGWNSSERVLDALEADAAALERGWGAAVAFARFPLDTESIAGRLKRALSLTTPTHLLLMGQATARDAVALERVARNVRNFGAPDAAGRTGALGAVSEGGPATRLSTWPDLDGAAAALSRAGLPAYVSEDAGSHLCNQSLYLALETASPLATFLHLPLCAEQVAGGLPAAARRPGCSGIGLDQMTRAVRLILSHTAETPPRPRTPA